MLRALSWAIAGTAAALATVLVCLPASWMSLIVERQTGGRFALGDAQGSLWNGSAFFGGAPGADAAVTPLLPGRFAWRISPLVLFGRVDAELSNRQALSQPMRITGSWSEWQLGPSAILLPAERLAALGAPLNTLQPSGRMTLSWQPLKIAREGRQVAMTGAMALQLDDIASRLSPVRPLGSYRLTMDWRGQAAPLTLTTLSGALELSGAGRIDRGRLQFSGRAAAAPGQEARLANLLNLLGQRRSEGGKEYISLEFK
ncbi:type II secretion system protein N [Noviherbaspirillum pedocola]|nr:type II secretion system protein N [Noviherbaspirillum pedocola]